MRVLFVVILLTNAVYASKIDYQVWLQQELSKIPKELRLEVPSLKMKIGEVDQKYLSLTYDPVLRNEYINRSYTVLGNQLQSCLGARKLNTNWYHFAAWASKSAGEVISGIKFENLSRTDQFLFSVVSALNLAIGPKGQKEIFSSTNALIALEMIPLGNLFVNLFCVENPRPFNEIYNYISPETQSDKNIIKAFSYYHRAKYEEDQNIKEELILMGSLQQLEVEQVRVDRMLKKVFDFGHFSELLEKFFHQSATERGGLKIANGEVIKLHEDIKFRNDIYPRNNFVLLPELDYFFQKYNVPSVIEGKIRVATKDWSDLESRMRFLCGLFWSYAYSKNVVQMTDNISNFYPTIWELKRFYSRNSLANHLYIPLYHEIKKVHNFAIESVGSIEDLKKRTSLYYKLYKEDKRFVYALNATHSTILTDEFASQVDAFAQKTSLVSGISMSKDLKAWTKVIKSVNQKVARLIYFSKSVFKIMKENEVSWNETINATKFDNEMFEDLVETYFLINYVWPKLEKLSLDSDLVSLAKDIIEWEHHYITQPLLEHGLLKVSEKFEAFLQNPQLDTFNFLILFPFGVRTSVNLDCFNGRFLNIEIENYLNPYERYRASVELLERLKSIDFDPFETCLSN